MKKKVNKKWSVRKFLVKGAERLVWKFVEYAILAGLLFEFGLRVKV